MRIGYILGLFTKGRSIINCYCLLRLETDVSSTGMKAFLKQSIFVNKLLLKWHFNVRKIWILKYIKECLKVINQLNEKYFSRFTSTQPLPPSLPIVPSPLCQLYQFHFDIMMTMRMLTIDIHFGIWWSWGCWHSLKRSCNDCWEWGWYCGFFFCSQLVWARAGLELASQEGCQWFWCRMVVMK